jgi:hypothetical protein
MATAVQNFTGSDEATQPKEKYGVGVLAGLEYSKVPNAELRDDQKNFIREVYRNACRRDYPARLVEVIQTWEAALFYRGFQFLLPQRGGGWIIPGENTGYGPSMQLDLALLPTNVYSASGQMLIAALTRTVPSVQLAPMEATNDAQITTADSAEKFAKVFAKNNDLIMIQTDASRYLATDGRFGYWTRFVKDGQKFGWEEDAEQDDLVPEDEPEDEGTTPVEQAADAVTPESAETAEEHGEPAATEESVGGEELEGESEGESEEAPETPVERTPNGQEVRTAHGKLELKIVPMMANDMCDMDAIIFDSEVDIARAKGMMPWIADKIKAGGTGMSEGDIARLARQNVKLGMQSTYVTSDSMGHDVTISRAWLRPSAFMDCGTDKEELRDEIIAMFPDGCYVCYASEELAFARNESMDDSWAIGQAYSGDGQNRNALLTSTMPIQKRLNNWLDLMNDIFVRTIPKKWMDSKAFAVDAIRQQTNVPGDIGGFKRQPGVPVTELIFVEPAINPPANLADFIKEYSGPLAELLSGAYPALAGGDVGTADSGVAIATQRDSALGRLAPTWHSMKNAEAQSMKQLVRWGAKCRDKSINERVPGGETITLEINDLKGNISVYIESDENFPESYTQRKNALLQVFDNLGKNPQLAEVFFNASNLEFLQNMLGMSELYIPEVASRNKQLGEFEILMKSTPIPNPQIEQLQQKVLMMKQQGVDPAELMQAEQQIAAMPQEISSVPINPWDDDATESATCWQFMTKDEGRKAAKANPEGFQNLVLHYNAHTAASASKAAGAQQPGKPPSVSVGYKDVAAIDSNAAQQILQKAGVTPSPGAQAPPPVPAGEAAKKPATPIGAGAPEGAGGALKH